MPLTPARKAFVLVFGLAVLAALALGSSGRAVAAQNGPSWAVGDFWVYNVTGTTNTVRVSVQGQTSLAIGSFTHAVWYVTVATTTGATTVTEENWWTVEGIRLAKTSETLPVVGTVSAVYSPPQPQMIFPLVPGGTWSGTTSVTRTIGSVSNTLDDDYSGTAVEERSVTVPAGTFTVVTVRSPSTGSTYTLSYYSEAAGWVVKTETYLFGTLVGTQELTSHKYSGGLGFLLIIMGAVAALAVLAAVAWILVRRRRSPAMMPPGYPQGPYPPQQPPQQPPYQGPPPGP